MVHSWTHKKINKQINYADTATGWLAPSPHLAARWWWLLHTEVVTSCMLSPYIWVFSGYFGFLPQTKKGSVIDWCTLPHTQWHLRWAPIPLQHWLGWSRYGEKVDGWTPHSHCTRCTVCILTKQYCYMHSWVELQLSYITGPSSLYQYTYKGAESRQ